MKKKLLVILSILIIAMLALSLSACSLSLGGAATITINISRADNAKDCAIEATTSYGTLTQNGDVITISINVKRDFAVTLSSDGFATTTVNVKTGDIKKNTAVYNPTFGDLVPITLELALIDSYTDLTVTADVDSTTAEILDGKVIIHCGDKYANPNITVSATGYEPMVLPFDTLSAMDTLKLVKVGNIQVIFLSYAQFLKDNSPLVNDMHNIFTPTKIGKDLYYEVPKYDGKYVETYSNRDITVDGNITYGTIISFENNSGWNRNSIEISKSTYDFFLYNSNEYGYYTADSNGDLLGTMYVSSYQQNDGGTVYLTDVNTRAASIILLSRDNSSQYAQVNIKDISTTDFNSLTFSDTVFHQTLTNKMDNQAVSDFSYSYFMEQDGNGNPIMSEPQQSINGMLTLQDLSNQGQYTFNYNGDSYTDSCAGSTTPSIEEGTRSNFADGILTMHLEIAPSINLQVEVYDGTTLLKGEKLLNMTYESGFYTYSDWSAINSNLSVRYNSNTSVYKRSNNYIDLSLLERVGEKTYRYSKPLHINNNNLFIIDFTLNGMTIDIDYYALPKIDNSIITTTGQAICIETGDDEIAFTLTYMGKRYNVNLNINNMPTNGSAYTYELSEIK